MEIFRSKFLRLKIFNWISYENLDGKFRFFTISKMLVGRFQNALTFFIINRFGRDFFQSCGDFHGGYDGDEFGGVRWPHGPAYEFEDISKKVTFFSKNLYFSFHRESAS